MSGSADQAPRSITELIIEYFQSHPNVPTRHGPVVDYVTRRYLELGHKEPPRDPWRTIRKLHQQGWLIKLGKGVYKYDPSRIGEAQLWDFPEDVRGAALKRDGYACVVCGCGPKDGVELVVDHIRPRDMGGDNSLSNAQTLCAQHNLIKRNYSATEAGKRYFIKMYERAVEQGDQKMIDFCRSVFEVYDEFGINGHIPRPNSRTED